MRMIVGWSLMLYPAAFHMAVVFAAIRVGAKAKSIAAAICRIANSCIYGKKVWGDLNIQIPNTVQRENGLFHSFHCSAVEVALKAPNGLSSVGWTINVVRLEAVLGLTLLALMLNDDRTLEEYSEIETIEYARIISLGRCSEIETGLWYYSDVVGHPEEGVIHFDLKEKHDLLDLWHNSSDNESLLVDIFAQELFTSLLTGLKDGMLRGLPGNDFDDAKGEVLSSSRGQTMESSVVAKVVDVFLSWQKIAFDAAHRNLPALGRLSLALTESARQGLVGVLCILLNLGVDSNLPDEKGEAPLYVCFENGYEGCARVLISFGASDPSILSMLLQHAIDSGIGPVKIISTYRTQFLGMNEELILDACLGTKIIDRYGHHMMLWALSEDYEIHDDVVRKLVEMGVSPDEPLAIQYSNTALHLAVKSPAMLKILLADYSDSLNDSDEKIPSNLDVNNGAGQTPL
ncbi:hypothetical protein BDP55DRAFT_626226 [Colletotrichum godetiae]|uniref:Ankyrin repeat protein n=1 Tax=Colletotrichum godetiae TaxID=1209918 RepID=A0AAJ0B129_9PEZI|nr:uncharacterized protein BDP55DRAFT_626226 [Colletotrichum godetiae]KAK1700669.1 hypothetical protein BDP55DRAFT_626226 [Colletotrichum godetiae]